MRRFVADIDTSAGVDGHIWHGYIYEPFMGCSPYFKNYLLFYLYEKEANTAYVVAIEGAGGKVRGIPC